MSQTKASGTTKLGRDSNPKYLGVKLYDGQKVRPGSIIIRQRGMKFIPGTNVRLGRDFTIYSIKEGVIKFTTKKKTNFNGNQRVVKVVNVIS